MHFFRTFLLGLALQIEASGSRRTACAVRMADPSIGSKGDLMGHNLPDLHEASMLGELDAMGVSRVMQQVARAIGFDNYMTMWRILDSDEDTWTDSESGLQLRMQRLAAYKRYQRNRLIAAMAVKGMSRPEISRVVLRDLGEKISERHMQRLMAT
jgi:hypothetical protein